MKYENTFKAIDQILWKEQGCGSELDYLEQKSTEVLFFTKGVPTEKIWYYQIDKHFTKTQPLTEVDMEEFLTLQKTKAESEHSWTIDVSALDDTCNLSVKNPNKVEVVDKRTPSEIAESIFALNSENQALINELMEMVK